MANLTTIFQLSTSGVARDRVNFTSSKTAIVKNPAIQTGTLSVSTIATLATAPAGATATDGLYFYAKNTDSTNFVLVRRDNGNNMMKLHAGEFTFFPLADGIGLEMQADTDTVKVEYGFFKKG